MIEIRKIERGTAVMPLQLFSSLLLYLFNVYHGRSYLLIGDELGSATDIGRLLESSASKATPTFPLTGNDDFWSCHTYILHILGQKCRQKLVLSSLRGYLGENESDSPNCLDLHTSNYCCATVSVSQFRNPNLQWLTRFDFNTFTLSAFWLAQLVSHIRFCFYIWFSASKRSVWTAVAPFLSKCPPIFSRNEHIRPPPPDKKRCPFESFGFTLIRKLHTNFLLEVRKIESGKRWQIPCGRLARVLVNGRRRRLLTGGGGERAEGDTRCSLTMDEFVYGRVCVSRQVPIFIITIQNHIIRDTLGIPGTFLV